MKKLISVMILTISIILTGCGEAENGTIETSGGTEPETEIENQVYKELEVGDNAPDFSVELLSGETLKLSDLKGKAVFINFWATWCGPCVIEFPAIQELSDAFPDDLVVIAVNCNESKSKVEDFINENGYDFNVGLDENGVIQNKYPTLGIPYTVIVDPDGVITEIHLGADDKMYPVYESDVQNALNKS